ncbi:MAG: hypothetical protein ABJZ55_11585 [Fuerstiella sp.]
MSGKVDKRKTAVINKPVQHMLAGRVLLHFFIFLCAGAMFGIINQFLLDPFAGVKENLTVFLRHSAPFLLAFVCLIPIFIRDTLTLSNRIAGPIYNLRKTIQSHVDGDRDIRPLRFRKKDFWPDLPAAFNAMIARSGRADSVAKPEQKEGRDLVEV